MEGVVVEEHASVAGGAVVAPGTIVGKAQLWAGNPAMFVRDLTAEEQSLNLRVSEEYYELGQTHRNEFLPYGTMYQDSERALDELKKHMKVLEEKEEEEKRNATSS